MLCGKGKGRGEGRSGAFQSVWKVSSVVGQEVHWAKPTMAVERIVNGVVDIGSVQNFLGRDWKLRSRSRAVELAKGETDIAPGVADYHLRVKTDDQQLWNHTKADAVYCTID